MANALDPNRKGFRTHVPQEAWDDLFSALGRFTYMYGRAESSLNSSILNYVTARLTPKAPRDHFIMQALVGSQRFAPAREAIKRLMRISGATAEQHAEGKRILDQLGEIQYLRDRVAHSGLVPDLSQDDTDIWWGTSSLTTAREFGAGDVLYFTPQMLRDAAEDLRFIPDLLFEALSPEFVEFAKQYTANEPPNPLRDELERQKRAPWRYKPSQLRKVHPRFPTTRKSRAHPPSPSQE